MSFLIRVIQMNSDFLSSRMQMKQSRQRRSNEQLTISKLKKNITNSLLFLYEPHCPKLLRHIERNPNIAVYQQKNPMSSYSMAQLPSTHSSSTSTPPNGWEYFLIIYTYFCWFQYFIQIIFSCYCWDLLTINTVLLLMPKFFLAVTLLAVMALPTAAAKTIFKWKLWTSILSDPPRQ